MTRLILFDIDGTLLHAPAAGRVAFAQAFKAAFGWDQTVEHINFYGATDLGVFRKICAERGVESTPEMEQAFFTHLAPALEARLVAAPPVLFPNIGNLLEILSADKSGWRMGIVTGNIETNAWAKLRHAGIDQYFSFGGFGCTQADRAEIARQALENSGVTSADRAVLVGDTPSDVSAARANGMVAVAVATGGFDFQTLEKTGADFVFEDLTDTERVLSVLTEGGLSE